MILINTCFCNALFFKYFVIHLTLWIFWVNVSNFSMLFSCTVSFYQGQFNSIVNWKSDKFNSIVLIFNFFYLLFKAYLKIIRFLQNYQLSGSIPSYIGNQTELTELFIIFKLIYSLFKSFSILIKDTLTTINY